VAVGSLEALFANLESSEVIELSGLEGRLDLTPIRALHGVCRVVRGTSLVRLYVKRAADLLGPLQKIIMRERSVRLKVAPLSLEDLFLHLTGSESRE
jgi:hypothetical protein